MRTLRLARIAAEAEGLRLRHSARRTAVRAALGVVAMAFVLGMVVFVHIAAWFWLRASWPGQHVALMLAGADLVMALVLGGIAALSAPGRTELEAIAVRQRALEGASASIAWSALALQLLRVVGNLVSRSRR
jgi:hypothetical protein